MVDDPSLSRPVGPQRALDGPVPAAGQARYAPVKVIGEGGMGRVDQVEDAVLGRQVAKKVMHPDIASRPDGVRRFLREARVQGQLEHPAVVPVYDLGLDAEGLPWFTMKQVRGLTLHDVLEGLAQGDAALQARFPRRRLLAAFVQVCRAIDYAHSRAVLHRDLKPGNVMLGEFGVVHVLDWGLAQVAHDASAPEAGPEPLRAGSVYGTPGYMAPEQILREPLDERADVYALGAILFEVLTLTPMFDGASDARVARALGDDPPAPSTVADVPPELDAIVAAATRRLPADRTASVRELAESVERYLDGDRDLELRRALATSHLERARPLVDALDTASLDQREHAMREVNGALALDPGNALGLELLRRLLTHVPDTLPPEVEQARRRAEGTAAAGVARTVSLRMVMWMVLTPLVWAMGPLDVPMATGIVASILAAFAAAWWAGRRPALTRAGIGLVLALSALPLLGASLIFGAFVLVPALASTGMVLAASHLEPKARTPVIVIGVLVVLAPFALGELGWWPGSYVFEGDALHIVPRAVHFPPGLSKLFLVLATITTLALPSLLAGQIRDRLARAEERLLLTAWHLDRLGQSPAGRTPARPVGPAPRATGPAPTVTASRP